MTGRVAGHKVTYRTSGGVQAGAFLVGARTIAECVCGWHTEEPLRDWARTAYARHLASVRAKPRANPGERFTLERFDPKDWTEAAERRRHGTSGDVQWRLFSAKSGEWIETYYRRRDAYAAVRNVGGKIVKKAR